LIERARGTRRDAGGFLVREKERGGAAFLCVRQISQR